MKKLKEKAVIIGGDWNTTLEKSEAQFGRDYKGTDENLKREINNIGYIDIATKFNNKKPTQIGQKHAVLIDRFITTKPIADRIMQYENSIVSYSDHNLIKIAIDKIEEEKNQRIKKYWKLNTSLLGINKTRENIRNIIDNYRQKRLQNKRSFKGMG